jgi:shikimate dehydrogenase
MADYGEDFEDLAFVHALPKTAFVCDLVYTPPETRLLAAAREAGLDYCNGLDMLIFQAILADELFLGVSVDRFELYNSIVRELRELRAAAEGGPV